MPRRVLITSAIVAVILGLAALAPGLPPVRRALLERVVTTLEAQGIQLSYEASEGNAWRNVALNGAVIEGLDSTIEVDRLELRYFLPSLFGGELPLDVSASGVRGDIDLSGLEDLVAQSGANGGASFGPRVILREIDLRDIELRAEHVPFTLPDATLSDLHVTPDVGGLLVGGRVTTADGEVVADGRLSLPSLDFTGTVTHADVGVARQWWPGAVSGSVSGPVTVRRGQVNADLRIRNGVIEEAGVRVTDIRGTATLRYPIITADMSGNGLGGPVRAEGDIDIERQYYDVTAHAEPSLAEAAAWLGTSAVAGGLPVEVSGRAALDVRVTGWQKPTIVGTGTGSGLLAGVPLEDLSARLNLVVGHEMRADADALLGGGPVTATVAPSSGGDRLELTASAVDLAGLEVAGVAPGGTLHDVSVQVDLGAAPVGTLAASWSGAALGRATTLEADGSIDADGVQAFFSGTSAAGDEPPLTFTGAAVLAGDRLDGGISVADLRVPALSRPLRLSLGVDGQLSQLALELTVDNERPVLLDLAALAPDGILGATEPIDLRGSARGVLEEGGVRGVSGRFGPVSLDGTVEFSPLSAGFDLSLAPVRVRQGPEVSATEVDAEAPPSGSEGGELAATVSVPSGRLEFADGELTVSGTAALDDARTGPVSVDLDRLDLAFRALLGTQAVPAGSGSPEPPDAEGTDDAATTPPGTSWSLSAAAPDDTLRFSLDSSGAPFDLTLTRLPVRLAAGAEPAFVSGRVEPLAEGEIAIDAEVSAGSNLAGLSLEEPALLSGRVSPAAERLDLTGTIGAVPLTAAVDWSTPELAVSGTADFLDFTVAPDSGAWRVSGTGPLAPLLTQLGLGGVDLTFAGAIGYRPEAGYEGAADVRMTSPVPVTLTLEGLGEQLTLALEGELSGLPISGSGAVTQPLFEAFGAGGPVGTPGLLVDLGPLRDVTIDLEGVRGAGEVPATPVGPLTAGPVPWSLRFDWAGTAGFLELSGRTLQVALRDGQIELEGALAADLTYGGNAYRLTVHPGTAEGAGTVVGEIPELQLGGELVELASGRPLVSFGGTPAAMRVELAAELGDLAAALPGSLRPVGSITAAGLVDLLAGPTYSGDLTVTAPVLAQLGAAEDPDGGDAPPGTSDAGVDNLHATFSGVGAAFELDVVGEGLALEHTPSADGSRFLLSANDVSLARFMPTGVNGVVNGGLVLEEGRWDGALTAWLEANTTGDDAALLRGDLNLIGAGEELRLDLQASGAADTAVSVSGTVLPRPRLQGEFEMLDAAVTGTVTWEDGLRGVVRSAPMEVGDLVGVPAQRAEVSYVPETGALVLRDLDPADEGIGSRIDVRLLGGSLSGVISSPVQLLGNPVVVGVNLAGNLANPTFVATVATTSAGGGTSAEPIARVAGSLEAGAEAVVDLSADQLAAFVPNGSLVAGYLPSGVVVDANVLPSGAWSATASAPVAVGGEPSLRLDVNATGELLEYRGELLLSAVARSGEGRPLAAAPFAGEGSAADATLDLGEVDWAGIGNALGVPLDIVGGGELAVSTNPLAANLVIDLTGQAGENTIHLVGTAPDDLTLIVDGPAGSLEGRLAWAATAAGGGSASLTGNYGGRDVAIELTLDDGFGSGRLDVVAGAARLSAVLEAADGPVGPVDDGAAGPAPRRVLLTADVPPGSLAAPGGSLTAEVIVRGTSAELASFEADVVGLVGDPSDAGREVTVDLSGDLTPGLALTGTLRSPALPAAAAVELTNAAAPTARLAWNDLAVTAAYDDGVAVTVDGSVPHAHLQDLAEFFGPLLPAGLAEQLALLSPELTAAGFGWSSEAGWHGALEATADSPWLPRLGPLQLEATAAGPRLDVVARAAVPDGTAELTLRLPAEPWGAEPLTGSLAVDLPLALVAPQAGVDQRLEADATVSGTLSRPTATGTVELRGVLDAAGTLGYSDGRAELALAGPELRLTAAADANGLSAHATVADLELSEWLPQLPGSRLGFVAHASGTQVTVSDIALNAPGSSVTGGVTVDLARTAVSDELDPQQAGDPAAADYNAVRAALDADIDLADLELGDVELTGRIRGPLVLGAPDLATLENASVIANFAAVRVGVEGVDGSVSGNLSVGGRLADPAINTQLIGDGDVRGHLQVDARPLSGVISVTSTLGMGELATDLRLSVMERRADARGSVRYGEAVLLFTDGGALGADGAPEPSTDTDTDDVIITGAGRLNGLAARLDADLSRAELNWNLSRLGSGLDGTLDLIVDSDAPDWLTGSVSGAMAAGIPLGDIALTSPAPTAPLELSGPRLDATFEPLALRWEIAADDLPLTTGPDAPRLSLAGAGVAASGELGATLRGDQLDLELRLQHDETTELQLTGTAYGGGVSLVGSRDSTWDGGGYFRDGSVGGFGISASATLLGDELVPQVVLRSRAAQGVVVEGIASLGLGGITVDQVLHDGPLSQALRLQGRLLPDSDLTLSSLDTGALEFGSDGAISPTAAAAATSSSVRLWSAPVTVAPPDPDATATQPSVGRRLRAAGSLALSLGPASLGLSGADDVPVLSLSVLGLPGLRLESDLLAPDLLTLAQRLASDGLVLHGAESLRGDIRLDPTDLSARLDGFGLDLAGVDVTADGTVGVNGADVSGAVTFNTDLPVAEREGGYVLPWRLHGAEGVWELTSDSPNGELTARYDEGGNVTVSADLDFSEGQVVGQLGLEDEGLVGTLSVSGVRLLSPELGGVTLDVDASVADGRVGGSGALETGAGRLTLSGAWGLGGILPEALVPGAPSGGRLDARLRTLELSELPALERWVPHLSGEVSGVAQLRDGLLLGQVIAPELSVGELTTPLELSFSGAPNAVDLSLQVRGGLGSATLANGQLAGTLRFERFPLNLLAAAAVGPSDFTADLTGVMRVDLPLADPLAGYLRLATEEVRLERLGVPTVGNVTVTFDDRTLSVEHAAFEGRGRWTAGGVLRPDLLDFHLEADEADFTPLLGLVPSLARLGVGAGGSFDFEIGGDAANPNARLVSPELEVEVSGSRYRFEETEVALEGGTLSLESRLRGLQPLTGSLDVAGGAYLSLEPFALTDTDITFGGSIDLDGFGVLRAVEGALRQEPDGTPVVAATGMLGAAPFTVQGTLAPLDLRGSGTGVTLALPALLVSEAVVDADLRLTSGEQGGVTLGGAIVASEVILDPAARSAQAGSDAAASADEAPAEDLLPEVEAPPQPSGNPPSSALANLRFDDLAIVAPQRVLLSTNLGAFEAALDLTLAGSGAEPRLSGSATALRGNLRFSGRDFTIDRAVASFTPNRGVYPELDVAAHTEFDKSRVLSAAPNVSFAAPREGGTFDVELAFTGPVVPSERGGFRFDVKPLLTSNAQIEVEGTGPGTGVRPFTEAELMSLVALGRFELNADLIGAGGLGEAVAQGAIDTAVDLLVVSGLENALREALGFDVVEIRTSAISSLLDVAGQPFGVSVRVGGYLNPELFASYRIGTYDGSDPNFGITNEVLFRYGLGPLDLDLIGRLDFPVAGTIETPRPELGVLLGYQLNPNFGIDTGVTLGTNRSTLEFGVTLRW